MRLSCRNVVLFAAAFTLACRESTAPPSEIAGAYLLETIDRQTLPANIVAQQGDTITVLWGILRLYPGGNAEVIERLRVVHPNTTAFELIQTSGYVYRVTGHSILGDDITFEYSPPCPPNALCVEPPTARVVGSALTLSYGEYSYSRPPSFYRRLTGNVPD